MSQNKTTLLVPVALVVTVLSFLYLVVVFYHRYGPIHPTIEEFIYFFPLLLLGGAFDALGALIRSTSSIANLAQSKPTGGFLVQLISIQILVGAGMGVLAVLFVSTQALVRMIYPGLEVGSYEPSFQGIALAAAFAGMFSTEIVAKLEQQVEKKSVEDIKDQ